MIDKKTVLKMAGELSATQVKWRRHFHQYPELSDQEFQTTAFIKEKLTHYKIYSKKLKLKTGAVGIINPSKKPALAIRTDIDALPLTECTNLPFKSKNNGIMHACGHDIHMAVVLGAAVILNKLRDDIPGCIKFLFQPAEEVPPGGSERLIKEGIMRSPEVKMILGLHVDSTVKTGKISLNDGPTMAAVIDVDITIKGVGGHAALPHRAIDAVAVASEVVDSIQKIISRETNPVRPSLITFGVISGGTVRNVIADKVCLSGTARTLDTQSVKIIPRLIRRTVDGVCRARGAKYEINILSGYPVLSNHPAANTLIRSSFSELFSEKLIEKTPQTMGGEDFSFYLEKSPGAMFRLGVKNKKIGADKPWHSTKFIADEDSIFYGTSLMVLAALRYFENL